jgi:hypothetical protein
MAIFKAGFTRIGAEAKQTIRYNQNRPGKDNTKITRSLWGWGGTIERKEAYKLIDEANNRSYFYRIILNFDAQKEDTYKDIYLRTVTEQTMRGLEEGLGTAFEFIAATHDDHTPLRHVHILALLPRRLERNDLAAGRMLATEAALQERRERDQIREHQQKKEKGKSWERER